jgi:hypothetical protein
MGVQVRRAQAAVLVHEVLLWDAEPADAQLASGVTTGVTTARREAVPVLEAEEVGGTASVQ